MNSVQMKGPALEMRNDGWGCGNWFTQGEVVGDLLVYIFVGRSRDPE